MHRIKTLILLYIFLSFTAKSQSFNIAGSASNFKDNTWIYLKSHISDAKLDSSQIVNGRFNFKGKSKNGGCKASLYTADHKNFIPLWLEPKTTTITFKNGESDKVIIEGSIIQTAYQSILKKSAAIDKKKDSLFSLIGKLKEYQKEELNHEAIGKLLSQKPLLYRNYIQENPNSVLAAAFLSENAAEWKKEETEKLFNTFSPKLTKSIYGRSISRYLTTNRNFELGDKFVDFKLTNLKGKKVKLSSVKGEYILLDFWSSWCGPCRGEAPELINTYKKYKDKGFAVIGISIDENRNDWIKAIKDDQLPWENVIDLKGSESDIALTYGIDALPRKFLLDKNGIIIAKLSSHESLKEKLGELYK